jgi:hypothetical protein
MKAKKNTIGNVLHLCFIHFNLFGLYPTITGRTIFFNQPFPIDWIYLSKSEFSLFLTQFNLLKNESKRPQTRRCIYDP